MPIESVSPRLRAFRLLRLIGVALFARIDMPPLFTLTCLDETFDTFEFRCIEIRILWRIDFRILAWPIINCVLF